MSEHLFHRSAAATRGFGCGLLAGRSFSIHIAVASGTARDLSSRHSRRNFTCIVSRAQHHEPHGLATGFASCMPGSHKR